MLAFFRKTVSRNLPYILRNQFLPKILDKSSQALGAWACIKSERDVNTYYISVGKHFGNFRVKTKKKILTFKGTTFI
jgi:hypothetical protein